MTRHQARRYILLFLLLSVVYHSNLRPVASGDSLPASLIPFSIFLDHSIALDRFGPYLDQHVWYASAVIHKAGTHWYSVYPIAGPVLTAPLYLPLALIPRLAQAPPGTLIAIARVSEKVVAVVLASAAAIFLLLLLQRLTSEPTAWILTLVFAFGTANWSTASQALWQHTFGQVAIIGCLYSIERWSGLSSSARWYWLAGFCAACGLAIRPTSVAIIPAIAAALWLRAGSPKDYVRVFLPLVFAAALIGGYNFAIFHNVAGGYPARLGGAVFAGFLGILLSPGRGLLIYTPIAIFALAAFLPGARESRQQHRLVVTAATVFSLSQIVLVAMWPIWWGGYCWGPRLLTEICAPVMVLIAVGMPVIQHGRLKWVFAMAVLYCCFIQALGVYCYPKGRWDHLPVSVNDRPARLWGWRDNPIVRTAYGGIAWEPYSIVKAALEGGPSAAAKKLQQLAINPY